ncbi:MAG: 5-formyltetrahydrofolate cyclo-ligase [Pseudomonadota bacterium]
MVVSPLPLIDWKAVFRKRAKAARRDAAARHPDAGKYAAAKFLEYFSPSPNSTIALYHPHGDELDTRPLAKALTEDGHIIVLPVVVAKDSPLIFRLWEMGSPLQVRTFGIPAPGDDAPIRTPDIVVVPLLGVRRDGARLGMGGGFYDRTLNALRAKGDVLAIGYGYSAQKMDRFPIGPHDEFLDGFVHEKGADRFDRRR